MRRQGIRYARWLALVPMLLSAAAVTGCGGGEDEARIAMTVRVLVRDINLREAGVDCAGTGAYVFFHNRAPYRVVDGAGKTLTDGRLPSGNSVRTFEEDLEVERVPTYCEFTVPVSVPRREAYRLVVDDRTPIDLTVNADEGPVLVAVVPA
jgi:hypothetical protein